MTTRPAVDVAVIMRKVRTASQWQPWRWELAEVVADDASFGTEPTLLHQDDDGERWLHPGFRAELFRDEAEGYYLNVTTPAPAWFVLWRMEDEATIAPEPIPRPLIVTLSYNEAARWLDAQETVGCPRTPEEPGWAQWVLQVRSPPSSCMRSPTTQMPACASRLWRRDPLGSRTSNS